MSNIRARSLSAAIALVALVAVSALAGCSSDDPPDSTGSSSTAAPTSAVDRPDGPTADLSDELTGAKDPFVAAGDPTIEHPDGYVEHEFAAEGTASSYRVVGEQGSDGKWVLQPDAEAPYRTRIVVRRPEDMDDFSGTV